MRSNLTKRVGCLEIVSLHTSDIEFCSSGHTTSHGEKRQASSIAYIAGLPAGGLCKDCTNLWLKTWESITGYKETREKSRKN